MVFTIITNPNRDIANQGNFCYYKLIYRLLQNDAELLRQLGQL